MTREKIAKVHSSRSQRAKPRASEDRKVTFKGVLDNPHRVPWPPVPVNVQNAILAHLVGLLEGVADYHQKCRTNSKKQKKLLPVVDDLLRRNPSGDLVDAGRESPPEEITDTLALCRAAGRPEPPSIFQSLTYGTNTVTKRLELQIENCRSQVTLKSSTSNQIIEESYPVIRYLFVCRADIDPLILIDHLPHLVATYNVLRPPDLPPTVLVPLPKGAETTLAHAMGVRRLAVLAIDSSSAVANERLAIANALPLTHIKQLRTTAPRDMRAVKEARIREKAVAKARRSSQKQAKAVFTEPNTNQPA